MSVRDGDEGFGIYVHWPFCVSKCPYCDFNSHVAEAVDHARWRAAYAAEISHFAARTPERTVTSVFFGGGTPSLMENATVAHVLNAVAAHWAMAPDVEITLEANPGDADGTRFRAFREAGVNRLSLGVQALDDGALRFLGRRHDAQTALDAAQAARAVFPRFSLDLIYARPGQTVRDWTRELARVLALGPEHLSLYQLTIEQGTAFASRHARGDFALPDEDLAARLFETTRETCASAGMPAYEISNHARPDAESRHNLIYWRGGDYVGIGPGAHGRLSDEAGRTTALRQHRAPAVWLERVERDGHATREETPLDRALRCEELLLMGLRLTEGVARARFERLTGGLALEEALDPRGLETALDEGLAVLDPTGLRATERGLAVLDALIAALVRS